MIPATRGEPLTMSPPRLTTGPLIPAPTDPRPKRWRRRLIAGLAILIVLAVGAIERKPLFVGYAYLFRVDNPAPSDALVVLLGGLADRPARAAELYRQGVAPKVVLGEARRYEEL